MQLLVPSSARLSAIKITKHLQVPRLVVWLVRALDAQLDAPRTVGTVTGTEVATRNLLTEDTETRTQKATTATAVPTADLTAVLTAVDTREADTEAAMALEVDTVMMAIARTDHRFKST